MNVDHLAHFSFNLCVTAALYELSVTRLFAHSAASALSRKKYKLAGLGTVSRGKKKNSSP